MPASEIEMIGAKRSHEETEDIHRKKFKASELPITSAQRNAIDNLLYSFKKKGGFDNARKKIWAEFNESEAKKSFIESLTQMAESEIERDTSLLSRERGKAATLIEGAVDRSDLYKTVDRAIDKISTNYLDDILEVLRSIRRQDAGDEIANSEEQRGNTTDEEYGRLVEAKRQEREEERRKELELQKKLEQERAEAEAEERQKQRELRRQQKEAERKEREEREERRRSEREKRREEERKMEEQREKEREERRRRRREEEEKEYRERRREEREREREWEKEDDRWRDSDRCRDRDKKHDLDAKDTKPPPKAPTPAPVDEKALEDEALELLLKEGKELAAKSRQRPEFDFEKAEELEAQNQAAMVNQAQPKSNTSVRSKVDKESDRPKNDGFEDRYDQYRTKRRDESRNGSRTRRSSRYEDPRYRDRDLERRDSERRDRDREMDLYRPTRDRIDRDDRSETHRRSRAHSGSSARDRDRERDKGPDGYRPRDRDIERDRDREREKVGGDAYRPLEKERERERDIDKDREWEWDRDRIGVEIKRETEVEIETDQAEKIEIGVGIGTETGTTLTVTTALEPIHPHDRDHDPDVEDQNHGFDLDLRYTKAGGKEIDQNPADDTLADLGLATNLISIVTYHRPRQGVAHPKGERDLRREILVVTDRVTEMETETGIEIEIVMTGVGLTVIFPAEAPLVRAQPPRKHQVWIKTIERADARVEAEN
ncbi:hypothetical protein LOZ03_001171 [Ophidiomyces ophidiicola]|nr:hypothetical protein LOZ03_001171 [Ophidiomyces ophidiicola]